MSMRKTSLYLDEYESARLIVLAEAEGISQAEVIRRAIRAYEAPPAERRTFALSGSGQSGDGTSIADLDMDELLKGFGE